MNFRILTRVILLMLSVVVLVALVNVPGEAMAVCWAVLEGWCSFMARLCRWHRCQQRFKPNTESIFFKNHKQTVEFVLMEDPASAARPLPRAKAASI